MKYDKFFALAKEAGIEECEFSVSTSTSLEISLFHGEIDNYSPNSSSTYMARGIYKGKMGSIVSDVYNKDSAELFVKAIIEKPAINMDILVNIVNKRFFIACLFYHFIEIKLCFYLA